MTGLRFDRIWASDQNWVYPTDSQAARGLSFLGTEEPTFDLHDAMFKELDLQDKWLYDQVRNACERFGQDVSASIAGGARDTMANAITSALSTQRKADEGGYGIVKMANADTTRAGKEFNQAVSPAHLSDYVAEQNTWSNTKNKPETATRWPKFDEVTDKPIYGDIIYSKKSDFDSIGSADKAMNAAIAVSNQRDSSRRVGFVGGDMSKAYLEHWDGETSTIIGLAREQWVESRFKNLGSASSCSASDFDPEGSSAKVYNSSVQRDRSYRAGFVDGNIFDPYIEHSLNGVNTIVGLARSAWVSELQNSLGTASTKNEEYFDLRGAADTAEENAKSSSCIRNNSRRVGFIDGDVSRPYIEFWKDGVSTIVDIATSDSVNKKEGKITRGIDGRYGAVVTADGYRENWGNYAIGTLPSGYTEYRISVPAGYTVVSNISVTIDCTGMAVVNVKGVTTSGFTIGVKRIEGAGQYASIFWKIQGK